MPVEIFPSLALELSSGPILPPIARPLSRHGGHVYDAGSLFPPSSLTRNRANSHDSSDANDDGNHQEIGQNDGNDGNDSRIDLVDMDDLGVSSPSGLYTLPLRAGALLPLANPTL